MWGMVLSSEQQFTGSVKAIKREGRLIKRQPLLHCPLLLVLHQSHRWSDSWVASLLWGLPAFEWLIPDVPWILLGYGHHCMYVYMCMGVRAMHVHKYVCACVCVCVCVCVIIWVLQAQKQWRHLPVFQLTWHSSLQRCSRHVWLSHELEWSCPAQVLHTARLAEGGGRRNREGDGGEEEGKYGQAHCIHVCPQ